jgi:hypothetical protein
MRSASGFGTSSVEAQAATVKLNGSSKRRSRRVWGASGTSPAPEPTFVQLTGAGQW